MTTPCKALLLSSHNVHTPQNDGGQEESWTDLVSAGGCRVGQGKDDSVASVVGVESVYSGCGVVQPTGTTTAKFLFSLYSIL